MARKILTPSGVISHGFRIQLHATIVGTLGEALEVTAYAHPVLDASILLHTCNLGRLNRQFLLFFLAGRGLLSHIQGGLCWGALGAFVCCSLHSALCVPQGVSSYSACRSKSGANALLHGGLFATGVQLGGL